MGRNTLQYFRQQITLRRTANIAQGEDANHPLALVDHWQATHSQLFHVPYCLGQIIVFLAAMDAWGHHVARRRPADIKAILGQSLADDIAVSHHADKPVILPDWNGAYIVLPHQFREVDDRGIRIDPVDTLVHCFFDFHGWTSVTEVSCAL